MAKAAKAADSFTDMRFPTSGLDLSRGFNFQQNRTTPIGRNVRAYEPATGRARGGSRSGLARYLDAYPSGSTGTIQNLAVIVSSGISDPGGSAQSNVSGRIVDLVATVAGKIYVASAGGTSWVTPSGQGTALLNTTGLVRSASLDQLLYFVDGDHFCVYDPETNALANHAATDGSLPQSGSDFPQLICNWGGRLVVSGIESDNKNWFMAALNDAGNWNYAPKTPLGTQAVAGNASQAGMIGDKVAALIPWSDNVLIFGCDHEIWMMNGDPMAGGIITNVSKSIGMAFGNAWCLGPDGTLYFFSNRGDVFQMEPGGRPVRISQQITNTLQAINTGSKVINMLWDEVQGGLHVFVTTSSSAAAETHFFWEQAAGAWWEDSFADNNYNPLCCAVMDGNREADRFPLIGSFDGYVRSISSTATQDDLKKIKSRVVLGPLLTNDLDALLTKDLQAVLGTDSGDVDYSVYVANTAEQAVADIAFDQTLIDGTATGTYRRVVSGTWTAGRNYNTMIRRKGYATFVKLESENAWALEQIRCRVQGKGRIQRRNV